MELTAKAALMIGVIVGALAAGYAARKSGLVQTERSAAITRLAMTCLQPPLVALLIWGLQSPGWRTALLPVLSAALMLAVWPVARALAGLMRLDGRRKGSFVLAAMFSNLGLTYGAFICYILLGEQGATLGMIWCLSFSPMLFTVGLLIGRHYGHEEAQPAGRMIREAFTDPRTRNVLLGLALGAVLFAAGVPRPAWAAPVVDVAIPLVTGIYLFAIGLSLRLTSVLVYWRECLVLGAVKFLITPAIALGLAWVVGLWSLQDRALLQVTFIQSTTPAAIMGLVAAQLFDLDHDLANAAWLTTNLAAIALAPMVLHIAAAL